MKTAFMNSLPPARPVGREGFTLLDLLVPVADVLLNSGTEFLWAMPLSLSPGFSRL